MKGYGAQIVPQDRWAIVAYIRAMQVAQGPDILADIDSGTGRAYHIDALAGQRKTVLSRTLLATARQHKHVALAVASSGIAATLLPHGTLSRQDPASSTPPTPRCATDLKQTLGGMVAAVFGPMAKEMA